jgi:hypothetical protein
MKRILGLLFVFGNTSCANESNDGPQFSSEFAYKKSAKVKSSASLVPSSSKISSELLINEKFAQ